jgi:hypothetical protein
MAFTSNEALFRQLSALLSATKALWQPLAFYQLELAWQAQLPALSERLEQLSIVDAEQLQGDDEALANFLAPYIPQALELSALCQLPIAKQQVLAPYPHSFDRDIPGRKWQQVQAYISAVLGEEHPLPILEWCGGKGHLGRCACQQLRVSGVSFDINAELVAKGQALSTHFDMPLQHISANALEESGRQLLNQQQHALALHACGGLHLALIEEAISAGTEQLSIAPCCYHLFLSENSWYDDQECYRPQSQTAQSLDLNLSATDLRTCVQQTVTAPAHDRRLRKTLQAWRLGFDLLQRDINSSSDYLAVPALANRWAKTSFKEVCQHIAELKKVSLPNLTDAEWQRWEEKGRQRLQWVTAFDLVRMAFRRPLELWLVLDRALKLEEASYQVDLSEFCSKSLTPRNILIKAKK